MKCGLVGIVGRPNSGKSTLINAILDAELSIVSAKAQTTRERVLGILTQDQTQIVFVDTPGIHKAREGGINAYMVNEAKEGTIDTCAVWYLVDPQSQLKHELVVLELLAEKAGKANTPIFILLNKVDSLRTVTFREAGQKLLEEVTAEAKKMGLNIANSISISARKKQGIDGLMDQTLPLVPEGHFLFDDPEQISDRPMRFFVAEKIREQLFKCLGDEIPYSCAVEIEEYNESAAIPKIQAVIHVERDSQKGMVIGQGGQKIKEIGTAARIASESFLGGKLFLGLKVQVYPNWTRDAVALKRLGYNLPGNSRPGSARSRQ